LQWHLIYDDIEMLAQTLMLPNGTMQQKINRKTITEDVKD